MASIRASATALRNCLIASCVSTVSSVAFDTLDVALDMSVLSLALLAFLAADPANLKMPPGLHCAKSFATWMAGFPLAGKRPVKGYR